MKDTVTWLNGSNKWIFKKYWDFQLKYEYSLRKSLINKYLQLKYEHILEKKNKYWHIMKINKNIQSFNWNINMVWKSSNNIWMYSEDSNK